MADQKANLTSKVKHDHDVLKKNIPLLEKSIEIEIPQDNFEEWRLEFMWLLRDFRNHCIKHFDFEEAGGFMKDVLEDAPETQNAVKKLEDDHVKIIKDMDDILDMLKLIEQTEKQKLDQLKSDIKHLIIRLKAHENAENKLLQSVYSQEYGYPS